MSQQFQKGLTLVELMIVVSLVGIFSAMAAPSVKEMFAVNKVKTATNELKASLIFAKQQAINSNNTVSLVCNTAVCDDGWEVINDVTTTVLQKQDPYSDNLLSITKPTVSFNSQGRLHSTAIAQYEIQRSDLDANVVGRSACVQVYPSGAIHVTRATC